MSGACGRVGVWVYTGQAQQLRQRVEDYESSMQHQFAVPVASLSVGTVGAVGSPLDFGVASDGAGAPVHAQSNWITPVSTEPDDFDDPAAFSLGVDATPSAVGAFYPFDDQDHPKGNLGPHSDRISFPLGTLSPPKVAMLYESAHAHEVDRLEEKKK